MIWAEGQSEVKKRNTLRVVVLWGMLLLLTLLAWLMQVGVVPVGGRASLTQSATVGAFTIPLPEDWVIDVDPVTGELVAVEPGEGTPAVLQVWSRERDALITPRELIRQRAQGHPRGEIALGEGEANLYTAVRQFTAPFFDSQEATTGFISTVTATGVLGGDRLTIQLDRPIEDPREWQHRDEVLVRRIAAGVERKSGARPTPEADGA